MQKTNVSKNAKRLNVTKQTKLQNHTNKLSMKLCTTMQNRNKLVRKPKCKKKHVAPARNYTNHNVRARNQTPSPQTNTKRQHKNKQRKTKNAGQPKTNTEKNKTKKPADTKAGQPQMPMNTRAKQRVGPKTLMKPPIDHEPVRFGNASTFGRWVQNLKDDAIETPPENKQNIVLRGPNCQPNALA